MSLQFRSKLFGSDTFEFITSVHVPNSKHNEPFTMALRHRLLSGRSVPAPSSMITLTQKLYKQLQPEELARMATPLQPVAEQATPPYDRLADIVWWSGIEYDPVEQFVRSMPALRTRCKKQQGEKMTFFEKIPVDIRRRIYCFVFEYPANGRQVSLSKDFTTKDVFPPDFFISPWDLLHQVEGALSSCRQMRDEVFTYFWNTYHFHVTFSPYSIGPVFSGASIKLLNSYACRVNHLTVEVDMTKLAFSLAKDARLLKDSNKKLQETLLDLVDALGRRRYKGNIMASLALLARRYQGFRPPTAEAPEEKVQYCPENALSVFDCFSKLRPLVLECRMSGFSISHTRLLLREILSKPFLTKPRPAPIIPAWPHYTPINEVIYSSSFNTATNTDDVAIGTPNSNIRSAGSAEMPGFGRRVSSFGYSQVNSSASSLVPTQHTGFYQLHENPQMLLLDQGSGSPCAPLTNILRVGSGSPLNSSWIAPYGQKICSDSLQKCSPSLPNNISKRTAVPRSGPFMTDEAGIPIPQEKNSSSSAHAGSSSFEGLRITTPLKSGIPGPARGTARSFTSRHSHILIRPRSLVSEENSFRDSGYNIEVGTDKSTNFVEVNAEEDLCIHHGILPLRKESLPNAAKSLNTVDELNQMNEMDPAFARAVQGLRMASDDKGDSGQDNKVNDDGVTGAAIGSSKKSKNKEKRKKKKGRKHWF